MKHLHRALMPEIGSLLLWLMWPSSMLLNRAVELMQAFSALVFGANAYHIVYQTKL